MIDTRGLTRRFDGVMAVDDLSLDVRPGEIVGLLGPNGAGKTTTLRMLAALIPPTSGEATVAGHRLGVDDAGVRASIGLLTEVPGLWGRLSARRNLEIHGRLQGLSDPAGRAEEYLRQFGLWDRRDDPADTYSTGMRQKLALARALLHDPPVLLLDEPTARLDPLMARTVRDTIADLAAGGRTILVSTHNLAEAESLCDRVAILKTRLLAFETPAGLARRLPGTHAGDLGRTVVRFAGPLEPAIAAARGLPFVGRVEADGDRLMFDLSLDGGIESATPRLVRALVEAGARIIEVRAERTLEDTYLAYVADASSKDAAT